MDIEDLILFCFATLAALGTIALLKWHMRDLRKWWLIFRVSGCIVWLFVTCSTASYLGRVYFGEPRGADFVRTFIYAGIGTMIYFIVRLYQHRATPLQGEKEEEKL